MVMLTDEKEKLKTVKQQELITRLLQSGVFSKSEFERLMKINHFKVKTSFDASVMIDMLVTTLRFRKRFYSDKQRAYKYCYSCAGTKDLTRYWNIDTGEQRILCLKCDERWKNI